MSFPKMETSISRDGDRRLLKRGLPLTAVWIGFLFFTTACGSPTRLGSPGAGDLSQDSVVEDPSAKDRRPKVLTTFTILADMARNVAGDRLQVESITKPGAEIHGYEFTPSDIERAAGADLIVENGLGLELWAKRFTEAAGDVPTVTLTDDIEPLLIAGDAYAGRPNPHAWMSPKAAQQYVDRLVEAFSALDPEGAQQYEANAELYKGRLQKLDVELRNALKLLPAGQRLLVTCEGAFSYLARDYDLEEAYLWPVNAESQISPRRMGRLIERVKRDQVPAVFCETTVSDKAQREVARAAGSRFGGSFYVDSLSDSNGPAATLLDLQRHNVKLIRAGLGSAADPKP
ncbi:metal ABC transporter substrate-binding protein [Synechococcus sp. UW179A]|uniref:metal ABC transporter substrate-binding protein n=1 Tax=Synechococcus sp. UW179A TaxID=2575510 RepID=UPI001FCAD3FB|nr:metal ABC transporter substrate-binding protein [Synechococcus sp. UW179A]